MRWLFAMLMAVLMANVATGQETARKSASSMTRAEKRQILAARERAAARAQAAAMAKAEADYRAMLPFLMEQQRQQMERMSAIERNVALHRMATAAEYEARTNKQRADALQYYLLYRQR